MRLVLLGPPGAGKGTLAGILKQASGIVHISTGDILREEMKNETVLGKEARGYVDKGELVPDVLVIKLIENKIVNDPGIVRGYMLDGFPRTLAQARELDKILKDIGQPVDHAIYMETDLSVLVGRLTGRRICRDCGAVYHVSNRPPAVAGVCDICGGTDLYQRADDNENTIRNRMDVYLKNTLPIVDYYKDQDLLLKVDGSREAEEIQQVIVRLVNENAKRH
jgi:adenylate kinase